ncbi:DUF6767 domain-containing protein [Micromonospora sp. CPCC 206060]|uniref:DUF6767 domain-containing protein n=1 Tax=Micromonospora sp. CPCC 206060 TaxID=3122406 RepID=UPI003FA61250
MEHVPGRLEGPDDLVDQLGRLEGVDVRGQRQSAPVPLTPAVRPRRRSRRAYAARGPAHVAPLEWCHPASDLASPRTGVSRRRSRFAPSQAVPAQGPWRGDFRLCPSRRGAGDARRVGDRSSQRPEPRCPVRPGELCTLCQPSVSGPQDCGLVWLVMGDPDLRAGVAGYGRRETGAAEREWL